MAFVLILFLTLFNFSYACTERSLVDIDNEIACDPNQESLLIQKQTVGRIISPSPGRVWQNRTCSWTLLAPEGHQVWLKLTNLKLDDERLGNLEIYDGHSKNGRLIDRFTGMKEHIPIDSSPLVSPRNVIHLTYSGVIVGSRRPCFVIEYMFLKRPYECPQNMFKCRHNSNDENGPFFHFTNQCYRKDQICDGIDDCGDGTDEQFCKFDGLPTAPIPVQTNSCGQPQTAIRTTRRRAKIKGGMPAVKGSWPWMAALFLGHLGPVRGSVCGAVLINEQWLLSAAHCFHPTFPMTVHLGLERRYSSNSTNESIRYIEKVIFPDDWEERSDDGKYDIALVKMNAPIPNGNYLIAPICLPSLDEKLEPSSRALIAGWGDKNENYLKQGNVPIWDKESCQERYMENELNLTIDDTFICAGQRIGGDDTCFGDSGGPLISFNPERNRWQVIGITSQGFDNDCNEGPGLYTSVPAFIPWIIEVMNSHQ